MRSSSLVAKNEERSYVKVHGERSISLITVATCKPRCCKLLSAGTSSALLLPKQKHVRRRR